MLNSQNTIVVEIRGPARQVAALRQLQLTAIHNNFMKLPGLDQTITCIENFVISTTSSVNKFNR